MLYASVAIIFNEENQVLILKRSPKVDTFAGHWCFPGGTADPGESPEACVIREVKEETGLKIKEKALVYFYTITKESDKDIDFYMVEDWRGEVTLDWESSEYKWIDADNLTSVKFIPSPDIIFDAIKSWVKIILEK